MEEKRVESKLVKVVKEKGGLCLKFVSPSVNGVPDRIILLSGGRMAFVETKATGKTLRKLQDRRKRQFENLGFKVYCLDDINKVEELVNEISST